MPCHEKTPVYEKRLSVQSSTQTKVEGMTPWKPLVGTDSVTALIRRTALVKEGTGDLQVHLAVQTADVRTTDPDAWSTSYGSWYTDAGVDCTGALDISSLTADKLWIRYGLAYKATSSSLSLGEVCAALQLAWTSAGQVVGGATVELSTSTSTDFYQATTEWIPYAWADKVKFGLILSNRQGNLEVQVACQTAEEDVESPDAWSSVSGSSARSANGEWCSGELDLTATGKMWIRFGIRYKATSGSASGTVSLVTTVR